MEEKDCVSPPGRDRESEPRTKGIKNSGSSFWEKHRRGDCQNLDRYSISTSRVSVSVLPGRNSQKPSPTIIKNHMLRCFLQCLITTTYFSECFYFTLCLFSAGQFGIPEGIVFSMPVKFENGTWVVLTDLKDIAISEQIMTRMTSDLIQVMS